MRTYPASKWPIILCEQKVRTELLKYYLSAGEMLMRRSVCSSCTPMMTMVSNFVRDREFAVACIRSPTSKFIASRIVYRCTWNCYESKAELIRQMRIQLHLTNILRDVDFCVTRAGSRSVRFMASDKKNRNSPNIFLKHSKPSRIIKQ